MKDIMRLEATAETVAPFVARITGTTVGFKYIPLEYKAIVTVQNTPVEVPFPFVKETYGLDGSNFGGHLTSSKGKTKRFVRLMLKCKRANSLLQYYPEVPLHMGGPAKDYRSVLLSETGVDEFYICNFWMHVSELLAHSILRAPQEGRSVGLYFRKKFNDWLNREELIQNDWGPLVMGQELKIATPELEECGSLYTSDALAALKEAYQLRAFQAGYSLAATNKSDPGAVLTQRTPETCDHRTALSRELLPISAQRLCRAPREQRGIREAKKFSFPQALTVSLLGQELPEALAQYLTELPVLIADFPHTVPGTDSNGNWEPTCSMNKDRLLLTGLGRKFLVTTSNTTKTLTEEAFVSLRKKLEEKPDFKVIADEFVDDGTGCVRRITVQYSDTERIVSHAKLVCPTGLKGITEPITTRIFVSHKQGLKLNMLDEDDSPLVSMLESGTLKEVALVVSASGIHSKRSDALVPHMLYTRMAHEDNTTRIIPDLPPHKWIHPSRSEAVDTFGFFEGEAEDQVQELSRELASRGQREDGKMYAYILKGDQLLPIQDKDGGDFAGLFGYIPWWRTRHRDQIGSDVRTFGPNETVARRRGVAVDSHVANLAGIQWQINPAAAKKLAILAQGQYLCGQLVGFPTFNTQPSSEDYFDTEEDYY